MESDMARSIRIEYAGASYHVMARGNRRGTIFLVDEDRRFFLKCLAEACGKTGWLVHGWVLMGNHYHLFLETPEANLVEGMKWLQNTYTRRFNTRHGQWGRLFGDRYKAVLVDGAAAAYYAALWDYLHLNPCRAGLIDYAKGGSLLDYSWSSLAGGFALRPEHRPGWLASEAVFRILGFEDTARGRQEMVERLDERGRAEGEASGCPQKGDEADRRLSDLKRGWYWGSQAFAERMLGLTKALRKPRRSRAYQRTPEILHHGELAAREILENGLRREGLRAEDLLRLRANDPRKVAVARKIWMETTVSQDWIAERLAMRSAANVSLCLHRAPKTPARARRRRSQQQDAH
jgi:REP element-mobilizing transposase RayT